VRKPKKEKGRRSFFFFGSTVAKIFAGVFDCAVTVNCLLLTPELVRNEIRRVYSIVEHPKLRARYSVLDIARPALSHC